jgi:DNA modification methylase
MKNIIYNENCKETFTNIEDKYINGIITSPPYNINIKRSDCYYNNGYSELD